MELDHDFVYNFISVFVTLLLIFVTGTTVFQKLKIRWPTKVKCWFCNGSTKIWRQQLDWWLCQSCEQYNGFSKDGNYMYDIREQYDESLNKVPGYQILKNKNIRNHIFKNELCEDCNNCEELKLLKLAKFVPTCEKRLGYEITHFKRALEEKYPLCESCKSTVQDVLHKKSLWLTQYKMLFYKQRPVLALWGCREKLKTWCRFGSIIFALIILYNAAYTPFSVAGLFFQLCVLCVNPLHSKRYNIFVMFLWLCIIILTPYGRKEIMEKIGLENAWSYINCIDQYHMEKVCAVIISIMNMKSRSYQSTSGKSISFKKIESHNTNWLLPDSTPKISTTNTLDTNKEHNTEFNDTTYNFQLPPKVANSTHLYSGRTLCNKKSQLALLNQTITPETNFLATSLNSDTSAKPHFGNIHASYDFCLNNNLMMLTTLSLSDTLSHNSTRSPPIFAKRVYSTVSPDLFRKSYNMYNKKHILSPPKLKSVMQTSWVAGGYWQEGMDTPSLSRSSSQSSGFGSAGSNFAPSREPSVHEFDRCSVISDATQSCYLSKQNTMNTVRPFCHQNTYCFVTPKCPHNPAINLSQNHTFSHHYPLSSQNFQTAKPSFTSPCLQASGAHIGNIENPLEMSMFPNYPTIITSPIWLSTLLCCSVVVNMIVLCSTFLR